MGFFFRSLRKREVCPPCSILGWEGYSYSDGKTLRTGLGPKFLIKKGNFCLYIPAFNSKNAQYPHFIQNP